MKKLSILLLAVFFIGIANVNAQTDATTETVTTVEEVQSDGLVKSKCTKEQKEACKKDPSKCCKNKRKSSCSKSKKGSFNFNKSNNYEGGTSSCSKKTKKGCGADCTKACCDKPATEEVSPPAEDTPADE